MVHTGHTLHQSVLNLPAPGGEQQLDTEQLQQLAASWDCVYLHNNIWPAAERAAGGVIDLVSGELERQSSNFIFPCLGCPHESVCRCGRW